MIIICFTTFGLSTNHASAQTCYRLIDLGEIGQSAADSEPFGINNTGIAVYAKEVSGKKHAFVNVSSSSLNPLGIGCFDLHVLSGLDGDGESVAHDVNDSDIAVGWATFSGEKHAIVWRIDQYNPFATPQIPKIDLGLLNLNNSTFSEAFAISNDTPLPVIVGAGDILGNCSCGSPDNTLLTRGFWRTLTTPPENLTTAIRLVHDNVASGCFPVTSTADVNTDLGAGFETTGVGRSDDGAGPCIAAGNNVGTYWDNPAPGLGVDLNGSTFLVWDSMGISDIGAIVGTGDEVAQYWDDVAADPLDIGSKVTNPSFGRRINNNDPASGVLAVAGWRGIINSKQAVLWECSGDCTTLDNWSALILEDELTPNCSGWDIHRADDVNDDGMIVCWATKTGSPDTEHAVLLEPLENCCPADFDSNGSVGTSDLLILLASWGNCPGCGLCIADLDCSGAVGTSDQQILFANWGPCAGAGGGGGGGSSSLESAVQQLGFPSLADYQVWIAQASEPECFTSGCVLLSILQGQ